MKAIKKTIFFLIILTSCNQKNDEKVDEASNVSKNYHEGKLQSEYSTKNGVREGIGKSYYANGKISTTCNYHNGLKEGVEQKYYYDGKLYRTREFSKGTMNGMEKRFYKNGSLMTELEYKDGMPGTGLKEYSSAGKLQTDYPEFKYEVVLDRDYEQQKLFIFYFSDNNEKVSYYRGSLLEGKYFDIHADPCGLVKGKGEIGLYPDFSGEITISAKYITSNRGPYIVEKKFFIH